MTALPAASDFTGGSITEGQFKTAITSLRSFLSELLGTSGTDKVAALSALGAILCDSLDKSGAYTVVAADKGKTINCTGAGGWSLSLDAAATLGDAFAFAVWNNTSGNITIDPNGSEQIDGATTKVLAAGKLAIVYCDGAKFVTVGSIATGSGSGLDADLLDGQHGSYYAPATGGAYISKDMGESAIGAFAFMARNAATVVAGSTYSGSALYYAGGDGGTAGGTASGTWRALGTTSAGSEATLFQRIS